MIKLVSIITATLLATLGASPLLAQKQATTIIVGQVVGIDEGTLCLTARVGEHKLDTLAKAPFTPKGFRLEASINEPMVANLTVVGFGGGFTVVLEPNTSYSARLSNDASWYIKGGALQSAYNEYQRAMIQGQTRLSELAQKRDAYQKELKYGSVSRYNDSIQALEADIKKAQLATLEQQSLLTAFIALATAEKKDAPYSQSLELYNQLSPQAQSSVSGRILKERVMRLELSSMGQQAPNFSLPTLDGATFSLANMPGKVKVLDFWASWCGPCRLNNPKLVALYNEYQAKGLEIVSVSLDTSRELWQKAVEKDGLTWVQASSLKGWADPLIKLYNIEALPTIYILDEQNNILAKNLRGEQLETFIKEQLK